MSLILSGTDGLSDVDGTAATPAIRGTDANTGIFFPAADTIAFSEGGVEAARIDSSGNFCLGTAAVLTSGKLSLQADLSAVNAMTIRDSGTSYGVSSYYTLYQNSAGSTVGGIGHTAVTSLGINASTDLQFFTANTERARIDSSGNLGLGVTPSAWSSFKALQVGAGTVLYNNSNANGSFFGSNFYWNGSNNIYIGTSTATAYGQTGGQHQWFNAASGTAGNAISFTQAMTLDANSNLLVGTTTARNKLTVVSGAGSNPPALGTNGGVTYVGGDGVLYGLLTGVSTSGYSWMQAQRVDGTATAYDIVMQSAGGNLGIGTTSPTDRLDVVSGSGTYRNRIRNSTGGESFLLFQNSDTGTTTSDGLAVGIGAAEEAYLFNQENTALLFGTNNAERARIDTSGNLLVGTTSYNGFGSGIQITRATQPTLRLVDSTNTRAVEYGCDNAGGYIQTTVGGSSFAFYTGNAAYAAKFDSSGRLLVGTTDTSQSSGIGTKILPTGACYTVGTGIDCFSYYNTSASQYRFYVGANGGISNFSGNNTNLSDRREKTNFAPAKSYLDVICSIPVQTFNYIDQNLEDDGGLTLGVVAQDVQAVAPELVMESNWASKDDEPKMRLSIYQTDLQYALMKCIQEQQALITQLTARLDAANL